MSWALWCVVALWPVRLCRRAHLQSDGDSFWKRLVHSAAPLVRKKPSLYVETKLHTHYYRFDSWKWTGNIIFLNWTVNMFDFNIWCNIRNWLSCTENTESFSFSLGPSLHSFDLVWMVFVLGSDSASCFVCNCLNLYILYTLSHSNCMKNQLSYLWDLWRWQR